MTFPTPAAATLRRAMPSLGMTIIVLLAACERAPAGWIRLEGEQLGDQVLRLPEEQIYAIASAPDGTVFVSTFAGDVHRRLPGEEAWARIIDLPAQTEQGPLLGIHAFSRGHFIAVDGWRIYRWREGGPVLHEKTAVSAASEHCGDFTARLLLWAAWGGEDDTYVVGDHGTVLHYAGGAWRLEPTPLSREAPGMCFAAYATDLLAVGGADGWVYAAGQRVLRSRGGGAWEEVPGPGRGDTIASIRTIASGDGGMIFGASSGLGERYADEYVRFYRRGRRPGEWREIARMPPAALPGLTGGAAHAGTPAVFFSFEGRVAVVRGGGVRSYTVPGGRLRLRGAVPAGRDVLVAVNDSVTGLVYRLPR